MLSHFPTAYVNGPELEKLPELRAKTDRQLMGLIHSKLEFGLNLTALAEETYSDGSQDRAEQLLWRAEQAVIEVKRLLPVLTEEQYQRCRPAAKQTSGSAGSPGSQICRHSYYVMTAFDLIWATPPRAFAISVQSSSEPSSSTRMRRMAYRESLPCSAGIG